MLQVDDVSFAYGGSHAAQVLRDVVFEVARGDFVGILGPNGSGKTTLLKVAGGMLQPKAGSVRLDGQPIARWPRRALARRIAFVPQETHAPFDFSVLDIVLMGRYPHLGAFTLEGPSDISIARRALEATGTQPFENRLFSTLSGGEKQRVIIAAALAQAPDLLLLDEPTASLDIGHQLEVEILLRRLNVDRGVTMILSTHDLNLAARLCRRLVLLHSGRIVAGGQTADVLTPSAVKMLYGVDVDIQFHPRAGHVTITPVGRA